jgi:hypothetical protein
MKGSLFNHHFCSVSRQINLNMSSYDAKHSRSHSEGLSDQCVYVFQMTALKTHVVLDEVQILKLYHQMCWRYSAYSNNTISLLSSFNGVLLPAAWICRPFNVHCKKSLVTYFYRIFGIHRTLFESVTEIKFHFESVTLSFHCHYNRTRFWLCFTNKLIDFRILKIVNSKGLWRLCIILKIIGFWASPINQYFKSYSLVR